MKVKMKIIRSCTCAYGVFTLGDEIEVGEAARDFLVSAKIAVVAGAAASITGGGKRGGAGDKDTAVEVGTVDGGARHNFKRK